MPPSIIVPSRPSGATASVPSSASTTPRGFPSSTGSTPTGAGSHGSQPGPAPWSAAPVGATGGQAGSSILAKGYSASVAGAGGTREGAPAAGGRPGAGSSAMASGVQRTSSSGVPTGAQQPSVRQSGSGAAQPQPQPQGPGQGQQRQPAAGSQQQLQQQQLLQLQQQQLLRQQGQQQAPGAAGPQMQMTPPPSQQQQSFAMYPSGNPLYGSQELDMGMSPMTMAKREAYTPAMASQLASRAQEQQQQQQQLRQPQLQQTPLQLPPQQQQQQAPRGAGGPAGGPPSPGVGAAAAGAAGGTLTPAIPQPGDLYNPKAVARAVESRTTDLQYLCEPPAWQLERPALTGLQLIEAAAANSAEAGGGEAQPDPADAAPQELRLLERKLVEDLLLAFLGFPTMLVRPVLVTPTGAKASAARGPALTFTVSERLVHPTLRETVAPLLPICDYVAVLTRFVETRSAHCYGMVTHALAAALRGYLDEWKMLVAMLEHQLLVGRLDVTRLHVYCQEPASQLAVLADVAAEAASAERTSAGLLNLLAARYKKCPGDGPVRSLLAQLLRDASAPYCACLDAWLRRGVLHDPYHEFMVQEDKALRRDFPSAAAAAAASGPSAAAAASSYWRGRYTLRRVPVVDASGAAAVGGASAPAQSGLDVPILLPLWELILRTGKYQNLLRECEQPVAQTFAPQTPAEAAAGTPPTPLPPLSYDPAHPNRLAQQIRAAHAAASSALLRFLMQGRGGGGNGAGRGGAGLMAVLRSAKHFFLLDQGDVMVNILEVCHEELSKPAKLINRTRLQSLLEMAIKTSSAAADPHADCLAYDMDPRPLEALVRAAASASATTLGGGIDGAAGSAYATPAAAPPGTWPPPPSSGMHTHTPTPGGSRLLGPRDGELPGWELFLPALRLGWPMTLVLGAEEQAAYQLLFKHLWGLKRCERQLEDTWVLLQGAKRLARADTTEASARGRARQRQMAVAHALCHQLRFAIKELLRYATQDVLEPLWSCLEAGVTTRAADVDAVMEMHRAFLRRAAAGLLLEQPAALRAMLALQDSAVGFARRMAALWDRLQAGLVTASRAVQVSPEEMASEQARAAELAAALDDMQRLMGEATGQVATLVAAVRAHHEELLTGGGGGAGAVGGGAAAAAMEATEAGGWNLEALPNLADRLDWSKPASGTLESALAEEARVRAG